MDWSLSRCQNRQFSRMEIIVFKSHSANSKHDTIAVDGRCFRFSRKNERRYAEEFRCCDDRCGARVLFNSETGFRLHENQTNCAFDLQRELLSRRRLRLASELLERNLTFPPQKILERVEVQIPMTPQEKKSLRIFVTRKRTEFLGRQSSDTDELLIHQHLMVTSTPVSAE